MTAKQTQSVTQADGETILTVENVTKRFGGLVAVDDVSFEVPEGQTLGLIGPNGAGKTTLFNVLNGFLEPNEGTVSVNGVELTDSTPDKHAKHGMARTFQLVKPFGTLNVLENVMVGAFMNDRNRSAAERKAHETLEFLDIDHLADRSPENITVAQKKKMELCRALATDPDLLLVDEIMAGLHEEEMNDLISALKQINDDGTTIVLIEHVMDAIMQISERIIVLNEGKVIADDSPDDIANNEEVIEAYLGQRWKEQQEAVEGGADNA
ncbi:ABC transporter ATP-binding protein [Natronosalvus halobius]|uniref:ABC transporter ATP-binding protein n=1 Tax=Natronosalvus halobius TaxID=2953746 RepID=UPI0020A0419D|nr:ABC transporter ATP-binding protein [Natronosalvus halobius]USZ73582.1 ABC transporter ATP-binding protein [Natronosalvus halobius]